MVDGSFWRRREGEGGGVGRVVWSGWLWRHCINKGKRGGEGNVVVMVIIPQRERLVDCSKRDKKGGRKVTVTSP